MQAGGQRLRAGIAAAGHGLRPTKERPDRAAAVRWAAAGPRRIRAAGVFASGCAFPVAAQRADASATALLPLCASSRALQSPAFVGGPSGASSSRSAAQQHLEVLRRACGPSSLCGAGAALVPRFSRPLYAPLRASFGGRPSGRAPPARAGSAASPAAGRARPPPVVGRALPFCARSKAAALRSSAGSRRFALVALARCARLQSPYVLGSLRSRCGAPSRGPFSARAPLRGGRGRGSAALLRSAAPTQGGCFVGGLGACRGLPPPPSVPRPSGRGRRGVTTANGRGRGLTQPLPSYRIPPPAGLLRVSTRMRAAYKGPGLPGSGKFPLDKAAIRVVRCSRGVASAVSSQHRPRKGP